MNSRQPCDVILVRHGQTQWSLDGRHTGHADIPLTADGEAEAAAAANALGGREFGLVLVSPLARARRTCEIAGLLGDAKVRADLQEWDYGEFEGITSTEIKSTRPEWNLWRDGCPGGESPEQVVARCERIVAELAAHAAAGGSDAIVFAHGHILRALAATWCGASIELGERLMLSTAAISILGHERATPAIKLWNSAGHL